MVGIQVVFWDRAGAECFRYHAVNCDLRELLLFGYFGSAYQSNNFTFLTTKPIDNR